MDKKRSKIPGDFSACISILTECMLELCHALPCHTNHKTNIITSLKNMHESSYVFKHFVVCRLRDRIRTIYVL